MSGCVFAVAALLFFHLDQTEGISRPGFRVAITDKGLDYRE